MNTDNTTSTKSISLIDFRRQNLTQIQIQIQINLFDQRE